MGHRYDQVERFLGRLEQALNLYFRVDQSSDLRQEISDLKILLSDLQGKISEVEIMRRTNNALDQIEGFCSQIIPRLDAEWPDSPIRLIIKDLTVKVIRGSRDDYLWEIGSGANWLAYHVALSLALQRFFLTSPFHPVPSFLIYDQPSQVYFPQKIGVEVESLSLKDEDVEAVRKVFSLLGRAAIDADGRLQIIILDHADKSVWDDLEGVNLVEEWRHGNTLVPANWVN